MKRALFIAITGGILLSFTQQPHIAWSTMATDFGTVKQGDKLKGSFKYYNNSNTGFVIENIQVSCGCMVAEFRRDTLAPGDSASLSVIFDTSGKSKLHTKTIAVYSSHGLFELTMKANIEKD
ncbi:MAG: DUF1573 domain-containing protein [Chitinophagaceae bacterium]